MGECPKYKDYCQYYYPDLVYFTSPDPRKALALRKYCWRLKRNIWYLKVLGPFKFIEKKLSFKFLRKYALKKRKKIIDSMTSNDNLNFQPGDIVEVRSEKDIFSTLDNNGKFKGLRFTPEMKKYCRGRFRVFKRLEKILIESTGELRTIKTPTVILEGVICDGSAHGGCDRSCFIFWREEWLKRTNISRD